MKYVDGEYTSKPEKQTVLLDRVGDPLSGDQVHRRQHYAKTVTNLDSGNVTYYIQTYQGIPLDPNGPYGRRERSLNTKLRKVSKITFDYYLTYLKTNNNIYLTKAQRGMIDGNL